MDDNKRAYRRYKQRLLRNKALNELDSWLNRRWRMYTKGGCRRLITFEEFYAKEFREDIRRYMKDECRHQFRWHERPDEWLLPYQSAREMERMEDEYRQWMIDGE